MIRHIDPVRPATAPEPNNDHARDNQRSAPRHGQRQTEDGIVQFSAPALGRRPGRPISPPPESWGGAMMDLVYDAATEMAASIRRQPALATSAQANQTADRAWELVTG